MRHIIIGGSIAAVGAISAIRSVAPADEIIVINGEGRELYSRPLISYFLAGEGRPDLSYPYPHFLQSNRVQVINSWVVAIDRENRCINLQDGTALDYDRLLLATGSAPVWLPLPGIDKANVHHFYTLDDAETLQKMAGSIQTAVVIGSGLIGIKAAEALHSAGVKVTIVEREAAILPRLLKPELALVAAAELVHTGIACCTGQQVVSLMEDQVYLQDGCSLTADLVVMAAGVKPRSELAAECGLTVERGIKVNEWLQTDDPDIYAAGDAAQVINLLTGEPEVMALLPLAREQGWIAGINMTGARQVYAGAVALNAVRVGSLAITSGGISNNPELSWQCWQDQDRYLELFAQDGRLVGFTALNMSAVCGPLYNSLLRNMKIEIDAWQSFIRSPNIAAVPLSYWQELKEVQS